MIFDSPLYELLIFIINKITPSLDYTCMLKSFDTQFGTKTLDNFIKF